MKNYKISSKSLDLVKNP